MKYDTTPDALHRISADAAALGGCAPGVEWAATHRWQDVENEMDSTYAAWVLVHFGPEMSEELTWAFVRAVVRHPASAAATWHEAKGLTPEQYAALEGVLVTAKWRRAGDRPGAKAHS